MELVLQDAAGAPVVGAEVQARFVRPTSEGQDVDAQLAPVGAGDYAADVALPLRGQWEIRLQADAAGGTWRQVQRVVLR